ncbi:MAG: hypothetical protein AAF664_08360 [Planctomycetota bacterium]
MNDSRPFSQKTTAILVLWFLGLSSWGVWRCQELGETPVLDEPQVVGQVNWWHEGRWELFRNPGFEYPAAAMFPGYQSVLWAVTRVSGISPSLANLRWLGLGFSLLLFLALWLAATTRGLRHPGLRACQCWAIPVLFPFHFLAYTDGFSLLLNVAALCCLLRRRYTSMSFCSVGALACRQDNLMSMAFFVGVEPLRRWLSGDRRFDVFLRYARRCWPAIAAFFAFTVFVLWHGRIGLDAPNQQPLSFGFGNVLMCVTYVGGLFLPLHLANVTSTWKWMTRHFWCAGAVLLICVILALSFKAGHRWNAMDGFLRNELIELVTLNALTRFAWGVALAATLLSCWQIPLKLSVEDTPGQATATSLSVFGYWGMRLVPVLLIDPRYCIIPLVLWMVLRQEQKPSVEWSLLAYLSIVSMIVFWLISDQRMML